MSYKEGDFVADLESGRSTSEEAGTPDHLLGANVDTRFLANVCDGDAKELRKSEIGLIIGNSTNSGDEISPTDVRVFINKKSERVEVANLIEKKRVKEKRKSTSSKKPPRPPVPPRGFSLDAADQKMIKEIAELAMIKRARIERMKALKKMKAATASSTSSALSGSFLAFLFTVFFFLVLFLQGVSSKSSALSFNDSPQSGGARANRFIVVQNYSSIARASVSDSPNVVDEGS